MKRWLIPLDKSPAQQQESKSADSSPKKGPCRRRIEQMRAIWQSKKPKNDQIAPAELIPHITPKKDEANSSLSNVREDEEDEMDSPTRKKLLMEKRRVEMANIRRTLSASNAQQTARERTPPRQKQKCEMPKMPKTPEHYWKIEFSDTEDSKQSSPIKRKKRRRN
ncbi:hypothetical protein WR25_14943 [Diploscapter pachys]|uniref:Uncharacterized protein n=1 Tax=Diploscapter pachys TaxID=2018661 RepID=A0A2A2LRX2_9BILA|nr:hypothetical protein WR25_14943 [Diploscapter pachys]